VQHREAPRIIEKHKAIVCGPRKLVEGWPTIGRGVFWGQLMTPGRGRDTRSPRPTVASTPRTPRRMKDSADIDGVGVVHDQVPHYAALVFGPESLTI
jgi:hypothetical protein